MSATASRPARRRGRSPPPGLPPFQPLICYESLFPGFTREGAAASGVRPAWIVNVSNDAWFGPARGPWQHLNIASYRAIEEGLPMVRATPTGVSAVIDAYGRGPGMLEGASASSTRPCRRRHGADPVRHLGRLRLRPSAGRVTRRRGQTISRARSSTALLMIASRPGVPCSSALARFIACRGLIFGGSKGSLGSTSTSTSTGPE